MHDHYSRIDVNATAMLLNDMSTTVGRICGRLQDVRMHLKALQDTISNVEGICDVSSHWVYIETHIPCTDVINRVKHQLKYQFVNSRHELYRLAAYIMEPHDVFKLVRNMHHNPWGIEHHQTLEKIMIHEFGKQYGLAAFSFTNHGTAIIMRHHQDENVMTRAIQSYHEFVSPELMPSIAHVTMHTIPEYLFYLTRLCLYSEHMRTSAMIDQAMEYYKQSSERKKRTIIKNLKVVIDSDIQPRGIYTRFKCILGALTRRLSHIRHAIS